MKCMSTHNLWSYSTMSCAFQGDKQLLIFTRPLYLFEQEGLANLDCNKIVHFRHKACSCSFIMYRKYLNKHCDTSQLLWIGLMHNQTNYTLLALCSYNHVSTHTWWNASFDASALNLACRFCLGTDLQYMAIIRI